MKKFLIISSIIVVLVISFLGFMIIRLPKKAPSPIITYNNLKIETVESTYAWFDKSLGGNSVMGLPPEEGVKNIQPLTTEPNSKIYFKFNIFQKPKNISIVLWKNGKIVSKETYEKIKSGFFFTSNEPGVYVYEINGEWDETHTSSFSFTIEVKK
ncbi:MAG: hypothetical protein ABRQ27_16025 [Clostridiaceae bacterium]